MILKKHRSSVAAVLLTSLLVFFIFGMFFAAGFITSTTDPEKRSLCLFLTVITFIATIILPAMSIIRIDITDSEVKFYRYGINYQNIPLENHSFSAYTHTTTINFVYEITRRKLRVSGPAGVQDYACPGFTKKGYDYLVSDIQDISRRTVAAQIARANAENSPEASANSPVIPSLPIGGTHHIFPKEAILKQIRGTYLSIAIIFGAIDLFFLLKCGFVLLDKSTFSVTLASSIFACGALLVGLIIALIILRVAYVSNCCRFPTDIRITGNSIQIDDNFWFGSEISEILMSPPVIIFTGTASPGTRMRELVIIANKKRIRYHLGYISQANSEMYYAEYADLFTSVGAFWSAFGGNIIIIN